MSNIENQLNRMRSLMTYGQVNESANKSTGSLETYKVAADGKAYGIVRECHKFYIKTTTPDKANLAESYDYIGGWANHKDYECSDYRTAEKQLDFKIRSINEAYNVKPEVKHVDNNQYITEATESMRKELDRQRQIMENVVRLEKGESCEAGCNVQLSADPYTEKAEVNYNDKTAMTNEKPEDVVEPFGDTVTETKPEEAKVENSIASENPEGGDEVKMNEACEKGLCEDTFSPEDFKVDDKEESEIEIEGDEDEEDSENDTELPEDTTEDNIEPETVEDESPEDELSFEDALAEFKSEIDRLRDAIDSLEEEEEDNDDEEEDNFEDEFEGEENEEEEENQEEEDDDDNDVMPDEGVQESRNRGMIKIIAESIVNKVIAESETAQEFGKHPGYRKKPIQISNPGAPDIPFGQGKKTADPFNQLVDLITDNVVKTLKKK